MSEGSENCVCSSKNLSLLQMTHCVTESLGKGMLFTTSTLVLSLHWDCHALGRCSALGNGCCKSYVTQLHSKSWAGAQETHRHNHCEDQMYTKYYFLPLPTYNISLQIFSQKVQAISTGEKNVYFSRINFLKIELFFFFFLPSLLFLMYLAFYYNPLGCFVVGLSLFFFFFRGGE